MEKGTPTVSRVLPDETLVELVYDPAKAMTTLAVGHADGRSSVVEMFETPAGERLVPYSAENSLLTSGCVLLPSDIGDFGDVGDLAGRVAAFLHRYVDLSSEFEEVASYYVLLSWVYDTFNDVPYLRLRGAPGSGKTRGLLALGHLCYKSFFGSGASTVSPIFHIQDAFRGTLVLDEADFRFSDATSELVKVLNNGTTRGLPVLRTMTTKSRELHPTAFTVYGPKLIAMRESFADDALESRFFTEDTGRPMRADVPIHLPETFAAEACALRNDLLAFRLQAFRHMTPRPERLPENCRPRTKQMALALLSLVEDGKARERICSYLAYSEERARDERGTGADTALLRALWGAFENANGPAVAVADVARRFNDDAGDRLRTPMSNKWVGARIRAVLQAATMKSGGVYVVPATERMKVAQLLERRGISVRKTHEPQPFQEPAPAP